MKILAHKPKRPRKKEHVAVQVDDTWAAMCRHDLRDGDRTDKGVWIVREQRREDRICWGCEQRRTWSEKKPETRKLPCTEPDRQVEIIKRGDGKSLVHAIVTKEQRALCKAASRQESGWQTRTGAAREITCMRCLKSLGLYMGHTPAKKSSGKLSHHARRELWDAWYNWVGEYHYSDPRVVECTGKKTSARRGKAGGVGE